MRVLLTLSLASVLFTGCRKEEGDIKDPIVTLVDADADGWDEESDCDDADAAVNPDAAEVCDGADNNCDGTVDEGVAEATWYVDADGDGYGDEATATSACDAPAGTVAAAGDCDDTDAAWNPGAAEDDCTDPSDYNCDGSVGYADADGDGFAACAECDDTAAAVNPAAAEVCNDVDDDCDGTIDDADASLDRTGASTWYADADGDGYGDDASATVACDAPLGAVAAAGDCDDTDAAWNPGAAEDDCTDPADYNCDGSVGYADADGDGFAACADCDDTAAAVNPAAAEVCNGADDDCDGAVDDADTSLDSSTAATWYTDADADGYGDLDSIAIACTAPSGSVGDATDCDDDTAAVNPGAAEVCNRVDDDCDGAADPGLLGAGAECAASSCAAILADGSSTGDGPYFLEGESGAVFEAVCDMTTDGGGWTLVGSIVNDIYTTGAHIRSWNSYAAWSDTTTFGSADARLTADYKGEAWSDIPGDDVLVVTDEYAFAFANVVGGQSFADHVATEYAADTCNTNFLASGADWYDGLTAEQASAFSWVVRPLDTNATCFPTGNENAIIGVQLTECCWTPGMGNTPAGYPSWDDYDLSLLQVDRLAVQSCTAGDYPCNDNGVQFTNASSGYTYETKVVYAETFVR